MSTLPREQIMTDDKNSTIHFCRIFNFNGTLERRSDVLTDSPTSEIICHHNDHRIFLFINLSLVFRCQYNLL